MLRPVTWRGLVIGGVVIAVGITAAVLVTSREPGADSTSPSPLVSQSSDDESSAATSSASGDAATTSPLVATNDAGELIPPKKSTTSATTPAAAGGSGTTPAATDGGAATPTTPDDNSTTPAPLTPAEQAYLDETKKVVETNATDLEFIVASISYALSGGDEAALTSLLADGEGDQSAFVTALADAYPPFLDSVPGANVNIFATSDTTIYFAFVIVTWQDGGVVSEHTVPVPLRFVDGEWRLTMLGEMSPDLEFIQSVTL